LIEEGARRLMVHLAIEADSIDALIFVTQTPDYVTPATACELQHRLGLPKCCIAFDVNMGCSAFPYGLAIAHAHLAAGLAKRVLLAVGDTFGNCLDPNDKTTRILFGDGVCVTLLDADPNREDILGIDLGTDGSGVPNLMCPVGQARYPNSEDYVKRAPPEWIERTGPKGRTHMDGNEVFTFTLREVPGVVERTLAAAGKSADEVDHFLFHQANLFILNFLIRKTGLPPEKCPISISDFGNTSGASPAITANYCIAEKNRDASLDVMFIGFGIGYSWGGALVHLEPGTLRPLEETS
jgi:3-oxoacyl-[acyl-carrier-protein] synthase-3